MAEVKNPLAKRLEFHPRVRKIPRRRKWQPTSVFLFGKPHGQRSPAVHGVAKSRILMNDQAHKHTQYKHIHT